MKSSTKSWRPVCIAGVVVCFLSTTAVLHAAGDAKKIRSVEGITEYALDNGMKVLLFPDESKPTVTVNITYFVGSRHEGYGETGMAHLLEHMVFKGTPKFPQVWKSLQDHGASFNGTTWYDRTNYFETLAATEENLNFALELEADRMINSFIAEKDLKSEFSVVRNEFEMGENDPVSILSERITSAAYLWHNYGKSTIGSREDIERVPIQRLQDFYKKFYQPDNAMLVVAGKFDEAATLKKIEKLYGGIARPDRKLEPTYTVEPTQDDERFVTLRRVGDIQAVGCVYHICSGSHPDMAAVDVMADILDATQTGRLYKALIETEKATSVRSSAYSLCEPGHLEIMAEVRQNKSLDDVRETMLAVLDDLANQDISDAEVERARNSYAKQFTRLINDSGRVGVQLSEYAAMGDWRLMFWHRDQVAKVTPADVKRVAALYLRPSNRTVGMFIPTKDPVRTTVPPPPDVLAMLKDYKGQQAVVQGESLPPEPSAIEARTQREDLPGGLKLAMIPKKTRGQKISATITLRYGSEEDFKGRIDAVGMIASMLDKGTAKHSRRELADELDRIKTSIGIGGGGGRGRMGRGAGGGETGAMSISVETERKHFAEAMALLREMLREPTFPEKEFDKLKKQAMASLESQLSEPMVLAMNEMMRRMNPYEPSDVRYVPTPAEQLQRLQAVTLEDIKSAYKELLGASYGEVSIVGDIDASEARTIVADTFKGWKSPRPFERIAREFKETQPDTVAINTPDKQNALIAMAMNLPIKDDDADFAALKLGNFILGQSSNSRILNRLRQKEGLSYGAGSMLNASALDRAGMFGVYGICAPQNAEKAIACAREELDKLLKKGVTAEELEDARKGYLEQVKVQLSADGGIAGMLANDLYLGRTMKFRAEELAKIEKLTLDEVNAALRKHIDPSKLVEIRAGDFKVTPKPDASKDTAASEDDDSGNEGSESESSDDENS